jgi:hypothetical protein
MQVTNEGASISMDGPTSLAASLGGVGVGSEKLRELLCDVLQLLPGEEGQERLAEGVHDAVQGFLLAPR